MNKYLFSQVKKFVATSGIGWIIDFTIYSYVTSVFKGNILYSNIISSIPAITFVFFISTKKIFNNCKGKYSVKSKYVIYIIYQLVLLILISNLGQWIFNRMICVDFFITIFGKFLKIIIKIIITPVTMILNFLIMKYLIEKL